MKRRTTVIGMILVNFGIFVVTASLLPKKSSWTHSSPLSYFINSRENWDLAWGIFIGLLIVSAGVYSLLNAKGVFEKTNTPNTET